MIHRKAWHIDALFALVFALLVAALYFKDHGLAWYDRDAGAVIEHRYKSACPNGEPPINWLCVNGQRI